MLSIPYRGPRTYRRFGNKTRKPVEQVKYPTDLVFAAACAAQRHNGDYLKEDVVKYDEINNTVEVQVVCNKKLIREFLDGRRNISDIDREQGLKVRAHYQGLTFKILQEKHISDFDRVALNLAEGETVEGFYALAIAASLPSCYERAVVRTKNEARINFAQGGYVGILGDKVELDVEVMKVVYSMNYNVYFVTCVTSNNQAVFFSFARKVEVGTKMKIKGTVKKHTADNSTQLNRVKVI